MRELKFRAWCHKDQIMYYGIEMGIQFEDGSEYTFKNFIENKGYHEWQLMQSTGLKDKNGKDIYEDDIIISDRGTMFLIKWYAKESRWSVVQRNGNLTPELMYDSFILFKEMSPEIEVIGNIYKTPNLLK